MRITSLADYQKTYELSVQEPEKFWAGIANEFEWSKPFTKVLDWNFNDYSVKWFEDGQMNITANDSTMDWSPCLRRDWTNENARETCQSCRQKTGAPTRRLLSEVR